MNGCHPSEPVDDQPAAAPPARDGWIGTGRSGLSGAFGLDAVRIRRALRSVPGPGGRPRRIAGALGIRAAQSGRGRNHLRLVRPPEPVREEPAGPPAVPGVVDAAPGPVSEPVPDRGDVPDRGNEPDSEVVPDRGNEPDSEVVPDRGEERDGGYQPAGPAEPVGAERQFHPGTPARTVAVPAAAPPPRTELATLAAVVLLGTAAALGVDALFDGLNGRPPAYLLIFLASPVWNLLPRRLPARIGVLAADVIGTVGSWVLLAAVPAYRWLGMPRGCWGAETAFGLACLLAGGAHLGIGFRLRRRVVP